MSGTLAEFKTIVDAEQYFEFFGLEYDQTFVNVNRLHILKKFSQYIDEIDEKFPDLNESDRLSQYKTALELAYELFQTSTPVEQKLFKVFNDKPRNVVLLSDIANQ